MTTPAPVQYPPAHHLLRDLAIEFETIDGRRELAVPVVPALCTADGALGMGPIGVLIDIVAGGVAIGSVAPDWAVTSDMTLRLLRPCRGGRLRGRGQPLRVGANNIVLEAELSGEDDGERVALAQVGFTRIPRRADTLSMSPGDGDDGPVGFATPESGYAPGTDFYDALGVRTLDAERGVLELEVSPYVRNSVGSLQGGAVIALAERAAQLAACAGSEGAARRSWVTTDLTAHYLAMGRRGPVVTRTELVRRAPEAMTLRVELRDQGADERLLAVVTATVCGFAVV